MKNPSVVLLICVPAGAILMGAVLLFFALQTPTRDIQTNAVPLSKTSWQTDGTSP
jgi:hypothetical protein